jgi:trehalose 6-phosphate phosphatase
MPFPSPPDLTEHREVADALLRGKESGLFLDIDGTLAPIEPNPDAVSIAERLRQAIDRLARSVHVVLVSGRGVGDALKIVGLDSVTYAGNHGTEWRAGGETFVLPEAKEYVERIHRIASAAKERFASLPGIFTEDKGPSLSVHYRGAADPAAAAIAIDAFFASMPDAHGLRRGEGKMVKELRPPIVVDKGTAVAHVVRERGLKTAMMFGDDVTDVDAFRAVHSMRNEGTIDGLAVGVLSPGTPRLVLENVDYVLANTSAVEDILVWLAHRR